MKLETIKKVNKKKIIIGSMIVLSVVAGITLTTTRAKYRSVQSLKLANGVIDYKVSDLKLAIMVSEDGETYKSASTMPEGNYTFNTEKSKCRIPTSTQVGENAPVAEGVTIDYTNGKINVLGVTKNNTRCYVYFDKAQEQTSSTIIAGLNVKEGTPDFSNIATTDEGVYKVNDGMYGGYSYYWRGAATTNHVIFDNKCWRIVRINGDKSIRLIYNGVVQSGNTCKGNGSWDGNVVLQGMPYMSNFDNSSYVGWTYVVGKQRPSTYVPQNSGEPVQLKTELENWYSSNIVAAKNKVVVGKYCNDRNTKDNEQWIGAGKTQYYAAYQRLIENSKKEPQLSCSAGDIYELNIGMITADEVQFAGASGTTNNTSYYLYNSKAYWTMTPYYLYGGSTGAKAFCVETNGSIDGKYVNASELGVRPVINLRSDVTFNAGSDGTQNNPYIVQ